MRRLFYLLFSFAVAPYVFGVDECNESICVRGSSPCYTFANSQAVNWYEADESCRSQQRVLTTIESQDEMNNIVRYISKCGPSTQYWIGANNIAGGVEYSWETNGQLISYSAWDSGKPDNTNIKNNCVVLNTNKKWENVDCSTTAAAYICKKLC